MSESKRRGEAVEKDLRVGVRGNRRGKLVEGNIFGQCKYNLQLRLLRPDSALKRPTLRPHGSDCVDGAGERRKEAVSNHGNIPYID
jgi:hypothetical protein